MAEASNAEFIAEKKGNFVKYLRELSNHYVKMRTPEFDEHVKQLETVSVTDFITFVVAEVLPYKSNVPAFVERMLAKGDLKLSDIKSEEVNKLCRYICCFIDVCSQ